MQRPNRITLGAVFQGLADGGHGRGGLGRGVGVQCLQGIRSGHTVVPQAGGLFLEGDHGCLGGATVGAVGFAVHPPQLNQAVLQRTHILSRGTLAQINVLAQVRGGGRPRRSRGVGTRGSGYRIGTGGTRRRIGGGRWHGIVAVQLGNGLRAGHTVRVQAIGLLEGNHGLLRTVAKVTVHRAAVIAQFLQPLLQGTHRRTGGAIAQRGGG